MDIKFSRFMECCQKNGDTVAKKLYIIIAFLFDCWSDKKVK